MTNIEINELISVLEKIRAKQQPKIPASLIQDKEIQRKMLNIATTQGKNLLKSGFICLQFLHYVEIINTKRIFYS